MSFKNVCLIKLLKLINVFLFDPKYIYSCSDFFFFISCSLVVLLIFIYLHRHQIGTRRWRKWRIQEVGGAGIKPRNLGYGLTTHFLRPALSGKFKLERDLSDYLTVLMPWLQPFSKPLLFLQNLSQASNWKLLFILRAFNEHMIPCIAVLYKLTFSVSLCVHWKEPTVTASMIPTLQRNLFVFLCLDSRTTHSQLFMKVSQNKSATATLSFQFKM